MDFSKCDILDRHPKKAVLFFKVMMRLEFSLKEMGFVTHVGNGFRIDWDHYSKSRLGDAFFQRIFVSRDAEVLIQNPPSRQTLDIGNQLTFVEVESPSNVQSLLAAVCRVRNNLFHGGKSGDPDHDRNDTLVDEALSVVGLVLESDDELKHYFEGNY